MTFEERTRPAGPEPSQPRQFVRLLLLEDNPGDADLVFERLARIPWASFQTVQCETLGAALDALRWNEIDLALVDLGLPDARGMEVVQRLLALRPALSIVVLTGQDGEQTEQAALRAGAQDLLTKGLTGASQLSRAVRSALERGRLFGQIQAVVENSFDALVVVVDGGRVEFANPAAGVLFGRLPEELVGQPFGFPLAGHGSEEIVVPGTDPPRRAELRVAPVLWGGREATLVSLHDVTARHQAQQEIAALAEQLRATNASLESLVRTDPLTGVFNRRGAEEMLAFEQVRAQRSGDPLVAMLVDLDDFKRINDGAGHSVGDVVLHGVAQAMRAAARTSDVICRIGGDEFLAFLPCTRLAEARVVAERTRRAIREMNLPIVRDSCGGRVTASLGVAPIEESARTIEEVLAVCHSMLRRSKRHGKDRVSALGMHDPSDDAGTTEFAILEEILSARTPLRVVGQALAALADERPVGRELFVRGRGALELPENLFRVAREHDALVALDLACLRACLGAAPTGERVHANLLPSTLLSVPVERILATCAPHLGYLTIELNEQEFIGAVEPFIHPIRHLQASRVRVALDDVGFGRSSLETLIVAEPDCIKLDQRLVRHIDEKPDRRRTVARLLTVARAIGAEVVAEGIETRGELAVLRELGVELGQGYLWGTPRPIER